MSVRITSLIVFDLRFSSLKNVHELQPGKGMGTSTLSKMTLGLKTLIIMTLIYLHT